MSSQGTRWCFTLNNPTNEESSLVAERLNREKYGIVGRETGQSGNRHLQGFVIFRSNQRLRAVKQFLRRAHWELARGTNTQASEYCKKEGDFDEYGSFPAGPGHRTDIAELVEWSDDFTRRNGRAPTSPEVAREQPQGYTRYPRLIRLFQHRAPAPQLRQGSPAPWQRELEQELATQADDRKVIFYVDETGGKGKTWFQQWYLTKHPEKVQILSSGKRDDIAYMVDETKSVFFFNISRGGMEFFQYRIVEELKDRMVPSTKYQSRMKILVHTPHVVVFCNEHPQMNMLSEDRYDIRELN